MCGEWMCGVWTCGEWMCELHLVFWTGTVRGGVEKHLKGILRPVSQAIPPRSLVGVPDETTVTVLTCPIQSMVLPYMFGRSQGDILGELVPVQRSDRLGTGSSKGYAQSLNIHRLHSGPPQYVVCSHPYLPIHNPYPYISTCSQDHREICWERWHLFRGVIGQAQAVPRDMLSH